MVILRLCGKPCSSCENNKIELNQLIISNDIVNENITSDNTKPTFAPKTVFLIWGLLTNLQVKPTYFKASALTSCTYCKLYVNTRDYYSASVLTSEQKIKVELHYLDKQGSVFVNSKTRWSKSSTSGSPRFARCTEMGSERMGVLHRDNHGRSHSLHHGSLRILWRVFLRGNLFGTCNDTLLSTPMFWLESTWFTALL